jgi:hypothetical protein
VVEGLANGGGDAGATGRRLLGARWAWRQRRRGVGLVRGDARLDGSTTRTRRQGRGDGRGVDEPRVEEASRVVSAGGGGRGSGMGGERVIFLGGGQRGASARGRGHGGVDALLSFIIE